MGFSGDAMRDRRTATTGVTRIIFALVGAALLFIAAHVAAIASAPPVTTLSTGPAAAAGANGWFVLDPVITLTTEETSDVTQYQWDSTSDSGWQSYTAPFTSGSPDGRYTLYYRSASGAQDVTEEVRSALIDLDTTPPAAPAALLSTSHSGDSTSDATIDVTWDAGAADVTSGPGGYSFSYSQGGTEDPDATKDAEDTVTSDTSAPLGSGEWYFNLRALDVAGNASQTLHAGPFVIDLRSPVTTVSLSLLAPDGSNGWYVNRPTVNIQRDEPGVSEYQWDSPDIGGWTQGDTVDAIEGAHVLYARSVDGAGNTGVAVTVDTKVDTGPPSLAFRSTAPKSGAYLRGSLSLPVRAIDPISGMDAVTLQYAGTTMWSDAVWPYSAWLNTRLLPNGRRTLTFSAIDLAGNSPATVSRSYNIDNARPVTRGANAKVKARKKVRLYYRVSDAYSPTARVVIKIMNRKGKTLRTIGIGTRSTGKSYYYRYTARLKKGTYYYGVKATDLAGNLSKTSRNKLTVR